MRQLANFVLSVLAFTACVHKIDNNAHENQKTRESGCLELEADLNYLHNTMTGDFSGLHHNEELKKRILAMFPILVEESRFCASKIEYMRTIRKYFAAFKDSHVKARWKAEQIIKNIYHISTGRNAEDLNLSGIQSSATGIGIAKFKENDLDASIDRSLAGDSNVKIGDALLECDSVSATRIMRDEILPYESIAVQDASEYNLNTTLPNRSSDSRWGAIRGNAKYFGGAVVTMTGMAVGAILIGGSSVAGFLIPPAFYGIGPASALVGASFLVGSGIGASGENDLKANEDAASTFKDIIAREKITTEYFYEDHIERIKKSGNTTKKCPPMEIGDLKVTGGLKQGKSKR